MRLLASAQEGGSTVAECYLVAGRIGTGDNYVWHREWTRLADANNDRGDAALAKGNRLTARSNWLRAINYHLAAAFPFEPPDGRRRASVAAMRECARKWLDSGSTETVTFPWLKDYPLQGYLLSPRVANEPLATIICIGEPGHCKEEYLFKLARYASDRGLAMLALDLLGQGNGDRLAEVADHPLLESAISRAVDYLSGRDDVDIQRIAVLADGWGSSFAARGVAGDSRIAAAACDGGIWDLHERAFLAGRKTGPNIGSLPHPSESRIARNIECPILITIGERGWLEADRVRQMVDQLRRVGHDAVLKVFPEEETAAAQGHADNPTLANEFIFDWLSARLGSQAAT
ncbi:alpha/beta hydrolase family protein [Bradyrhizobium sp. AZCC 1719]|uniref:alpha/beta hydrolase family protein n=1 Tax=Bradyrhizobium sp. AZCC 1719 TaxID=3117028 RepID=UPI002FEE8BAF